MNECPISDIPILVTGLPRSGSSWVGQALSQAPGVRYRYESLNPDWVPALRGHMGHFRYQRPGTVGGERLQAAAERALSGRQSARQLLRSVYRGYAGAALRPRGRLVLKDPTACLLAAWLQTREPLCVAILVRHPCGFAASVQTLEWPLRLQRLLEQKRLVDDHLEPWLPLLRRCLGDPWAALGGLWAAVHHVLRRQAGAHWLTLSYEAFCLHPEAAFRNMSRDLGLTLTPPSARQGHRNDPGSTRKDSRRMATAWRERMSDEQVAAVMEPVAEFDLVSLAEAGLTQSSA